MTMRLNPFHDRDRAPASEASIQAVRCRRLAHRMRAEHQLQLLEMARAWEQDAEDEASKSHDQ